MFVTNYSLENLGCNLEKRVFLHFNCKFWDLIHASDGSVNWKY